MLKSAKLGLISERFHCCAKLGSECADRLRWSRGPGLGVVKWAKLCGRDGWAFGVCWGNWAMPAVGVPGVGWGWGGKVYSERLGVGSEARLWLNIGRQSSVPGFSTVNAGEALAVHPPDMDAEKRRGVAALELLPPPPCACAEAGGCVVSSGAAKIGAPMIRTRSPLR